MQNPVVRGLKRFFYSHQEIKKVVHNKKQVGEVVNSVDSFAELC